MKKTVSVCVWISAIACLFSGCNNKTANDTNKSVPAAKSQNVSFPLAGKWVSEDGGWALVIEPDGTLSAADTGLTPLIKPNAVTKMEGWKQEQSFIEGGDFSISYEPLSRQITIDIKIKRFYAEFAGSILDGPCEYYLAGELSEDGSILYLTASQYLNLTVYRPDPNSPQGKPVMHKVGTLDTDPNDPESTSQQLIFKKVQPKKSK